MNVSGRDWIGTGFPCTRLETEGANTSSSFPMHAVSELEDDKIKAARTGTSGNDKCLLRVFASR